MIRIDLERQFIQPELELAECSKQRDLCEGGNGAMKIHCLKLGTMSTAGGRGCGKRKPHGGFKEI